MKIFKCNVLPLNLKGVNVEKIYKKVPLAIQPVCAIGGSNLWEIRRLGIKQCGSILMTKINVCWEMFETW